MVLVDSSVWIDYFNGATNPQTEILDDLISTQELGIGDLMLTEVLQGFRDDAEYRRARRWLLMLTLREIVDVDTALAATEYYRALRKRGITVRKTVDTLIAAHCISTNTPLLYSDRDFEPFRKYFGLRSPIH